MTLIRKFLCPTIAVTLLVPLAVGCGGGSTPEEAPATPAAEDSAASGAVTAPVATIVPQGVETEAAESVAVFLDSLRRGDEKAANGILTPKAREELAKTDFVMQPLGTPEGTYNIGRVGFPYEDKTVALVECLWQEPATEGLPAESMDIVCEVHKEVEGWRISSIAVTIPDVPQPLFLNFEDGAALQAILEGPSADQQQAQQVPAQQVSTQLPGLPPQQGFAGAQQAGAQQQGVQTTGVQQPGVQMQFQPTGTAVSPQQLPQQQQTTTLQYQQQSAAPQLPQNLQTQGSGTTTQLALPPLPNAPIQR